MQLTFSKSHANQLVNQSFFAIEDKHYSALHLELLLEMWNSLSRWSGSGLIPVQRTTQFLNNKDIFERSGFDTNQSGLSRISPLPQDLRRALFICLVWVEAKRLNLFETSSIEMEFAHDKFMKDERVEKLAKRVGNRVIQESIQMVLRAGTYLKVRGDFDKNLSLANLSWSFL